jgi:N-acetylglucosamine kinase-like BadF-type ATPase
VSASWERGAERVLAVDGGNTKTDLALLDAGGGLLSLVRGPGSSPYHLGVDGCIEVLTGLLKGALTRAGLDSSARPVSASAHLLLAGADLPEERSAVCTRFEQLGWSPRLVVDNDTLALLRAGTDRGWGVAVVCGAGINCLGRSPDGREVRFLSFGEISGDWGGGADVGLAALAAAARAADGRGPRTILDVAVPAYFGLSDALEVSKAIHERRISEARLVELAPVVLAACDEDPVAQGIVRRLANEVIAFATAALRRLELTRADPDVVLGGGLLRALSPMVIQTIDQAVRELAPDARVRVSPSEPIVGAALLALDALRVDGGARARARAELDAAAQSATADPPPSSPRSSSPPPSAVR